MAMIWLMMKDGDEAADHVAEAAQHADHEDDRAERVADERMHVILHRQQAGGEPGERAADGRGDQINAPLVDAHEADDVAVLRDGPDRGADVSALEKEIERNRADEAEPEGDEARKADIDRADLEDRQPHADIAKLGSEQQRRKALQEEQQAAGREQLVERRRVEDRRNDEQVNDDAEGGHGRDRDQAGERQRHAVLGVEEIDDIHAAHDDVGIGDPDDVDHAEDQVEPEREQSQHAAEQEAVDDRFEEVDVHRGYSPIYDLRMKSLFLEFGRGAGELDGADLEQIGAVDDLEHLLDVLLHDEHRQPLGADALHQLEHLRNDQRREPGGGLVHQQQFRPATSARGRSRTSAARRRKVFRRAARGDPSGGERAS